MPSNLSSVISFYDQIAVCCKHVEASAGGTVKPDEIIVVNDGGDPALLSALKELGIPLTYARITVDIPWNTNGAENLGIFLASTKYISIEDTDHLPYPDFYEKALELIPTCDRVLAKNRTLVMKADYKPYRSAGGHCIVGVYTREILGRMKGFDERFGGHYGWNGADVKRRLAKLGCRTEHASGFYMVTDGRSLEGKRPMIGTKPKMEKENGGQLIRNRREGGQVEHPILNFSYTYERVV